MALVLTASSKSCTCCYMPRIGVNMSSKQYKRLGFQSFGITAYTFPARGCRFKEGMALTEEEVAAFEDYFYHITAAKGSGEHALRHILKPFAWAHQPLEGQLQHLKVLHH